MNLFADFAVAVMLTLVVALLILRLVSTPLALRRLRRLRRRLTRGRWQPVLLAPWPTDGARDAVRPSRD